MAIETKSPKLSMLPNGNIRIRFGDDEEGYALTPEVALETAEWFNMMASVLSPPQRSGKIETPKEEKEIDKFLAEKSAEKRKNVKKIHITDESETPTYLESRYGCQPMLFQDKTFIIIDEKKENLTEYLDDHLWYELESLEECSEEFLETCELTKEGCQKIKERGTLAVIMRAY